jgi:hypothetical protein
MRMASGVRTGECTTYGDISIAVRDDTKGGSLRQRAGVGPLPQLAWDLGAQGDLEKLRQRNDTVDEYAAHELAQP